MVVAKRKLTYQDYLQTPDDVRYELIDGELVLMPSPKEIHQRLIFRLGFPLDAFVLENFLGIVYPAPFDVYFSDTAILQPDILFVSNERAHIVTEDNVQGAPDLVVEIISPSDPNRDRVRKRRIYERHGVGEYWLVDPYARNITVLLLDGDGYETDGIYGIGDTLNSPTLPGFALSIADLF